jgi:hypothetical protein
MLNDEIKKINFKKRPKKWPESTRFNLLNPRLRSWDEDNQREKTKKKV